MAQTTQNYKRINITLPSETVKLISTITKTGERSRLFDDAVKFYVAKISRDNIKRLLKEGAVQRADRDLFLAKEWFHVDDETWSKIK